MPAQADPDPSYLSGLVDHPREAPEVEYKNWLDLSDKEVRAKLARHICALANFGGGWLVFGVEDDGSPSEPHPGDLTAYGQDAINGIAAKFLTPLVHCEVYEVRSIRTGKSYPAVRVPPHGTVPVCAKAGGPMKDKVNVGIAQGTHYVRIAGPQSVPVNTPELWRDLIHRCVINEREALLGSIRGLLDRPTVAPETASLDRLLDAGSEAWNSLTPASGFGIDARSNRVAYAFRLLKEDGTPTSLIPLKDLKQALREASYAADAWIRLGWSFFLEAGSRGEAPFVDVVDGVECLQADMVAPDGKFTSVPTLWRASVDGSGFEVRTLHEDGDWFIQAMKQRTSARWEKGENIVPIFQMRVAWQFIVFVREFAARFPDAAKADLGIEYLGLKGRNVNDPDPRVSFLQGRATRDTRRTVVRTSVASLAGDGALEATSALVNPMLRLFDGYEMTVDHIQRRLKH
ncbi:AlbA family DNA-binding domain-containing protein [Methylorubrum extorquens]|nr:ATP-binding protein [Methylorubrum extorquens]